MKHKFSRQELQSNEYKMERIEAYNVAIDALRMHESASEENVDLSRRLRENLAYSLEGQIWKWRIARDC